MLVILMTLTMLLGCHTSNTSKIDEDTAMQWTKEKANTWFDNQPWPVGFNYVPANAINYTEMWMPYSFDAELIDKEMALAESVGFNCARVGLPFVVWEHDPIAFKGLVDTFLQICETRGIKVMLSLFDDCGFGDGSKLENPWYGKQPEVLEGWYANGWTPSPGYNIVNDSTTWPRLEKFVKDVVSTFKDDSRVWIWDLYNEPTNHRSGDVSIPLLEKVFEWTRKVNPSQPLTVGQWNNNEKLNTVIFGNSDVVTFHNYHNADDLLKTIKTLKQQGRPIINTEWLHRAQGSLVETCLPVFKQENVGCMHWGLVNGKTQTDLNWGHRPGDPEPEVWQHDLYHENHTVYDQQEINLFKESIGQE